VIHYFRADAPIRRKFDILILLLAVVTAIPLAVTLTGWAGTWGVIASELAMMAAVLGLMATAKKQVCDPYVNTVIRMEGLAAGDLATAIPHVDYQDCVGRMSRSMLIFRDNAKAREDADAALQDVIGEVTAALGHLRDGDLGYSIRINAALSEKANAISHAFNDATTELAAILAKVADTAGNVLNGATEIRSASDDLAARTEQQAANLRDSAIAMAEVTQMVQQTAANAGEVGNQVAEAHGAATDGGKVVQRAVDAMHAIQKSASEITNIIDVIDGIAFQTNLLALNAGVGTLFSLADFVDKHPRLGLPPDPLGPASWAVWLLGNIGWLLGLFGLGTLVMLAVQNWREIVPALRQLLARADRKGSYGKLDQDDDAA
jgi:methyl-accepting chemotaxis protein